MSLIIYITEKLFRTAHADIFLLVYHQKVCVSTICREKACLENIILWGKTKKAGVLAKDFCPFLESWHFVNIRAMQTDLLFIYLFRGRVEKDQPRSRTDDCMAKIPYKTHR